MPDNMNVSTTGTGDRHTTIAHYLLDLAGIGSDAFPHLSDSGWESFTSAARQHKLDLYLGEWLLDRHADALSPPAAAGISLDLVRNSARNALVLKQIAELAALFADAGIPLAVMKGAACLVRSMKSRSWRFLSDIDVIVPPDAIDDAARVLERTGYAPNWDQAPIPNSHHIVPYVNPVKASFIEVHTEPYGHSHYHAPSLPDLFRDAVTIDLDGIPVTVPSLTDHIWILMRTDSIPRPYLPRLIDALETATLLGEEHGERFDVPMLMERARRDGCPHIVAGMSYACERYLDVPAFAPQTGAPLERWEAWTRIIERRYWLGGGDFDISRNRFAALTFTTGQGLMAKLRYFARIVRYECNEDRATGTILRHVPPLLIGWRAIKDILAYVWIFGEYLIMRAAGRV